MAIVCRQRLVKTAGKLRVIHIADTDSWDSFLLAPPWLPPYPPQKRASTLQLQSPFL